MNAVTKGMNWAGCGETMPNLSAAYVNYQLNGGFEKRATTLFNTREESSPAKSCYYDMIYRDFMIPKRPYLLEGGYTEMRYERVIPFWQLHLYASFVKDYPDFYKDLYNFMRTGSSLSDAPGSVAIREDSQRFAQRGPHRLFRSIRIPLASNEFLRR